MFTGIVTDLGEVANVIPHDDRIIEIVCFIKKSFPWERQSPAMAYALPL